MPNRPLRPLHPLRLFRLLVLSALVLGSSLAADSRTQTPGTPSDTPPPTPGWIQGSVRAPEGSELPSEGIVRMSLCSSGEEMPSREIPLALDAKGRFGLGIVAECVDLTLKIADFVAVELPAVPVDPAAPTDVGEIPLRPGAALLGQVLAAEDGRPIAEATVEVLETTRDREPLRSVQTDERGWYRVSNLAPQPVVVRVTSAGRPPVVLSGVELEAGRRKTLEPVEAARSAELEILIPAGPGAPLGEPLLVSATRKGSEALGLDDPPRERLAPGDAVRFTDLVPGRWKITVQVNPGETGLTTTLAEIEVDLPPGSTVHQVIELPAVKRTGRVVYRDEPVRATLRFFPESPDAVGGAIEGASAGTDGVFPVPPRLRGSYRVHVHSDSLDTWLTSVAIEDSDEPLVLRIPEGRIQGTLVDSLGEPVPSVLVVAHGRGAHRELLQASARSDEDGIFAFEGLAAGRWQIQASRKTQFTRAHIETLGQDEEVSGVKLQLEPGRVIAGQMVGAAGEPVLDAFARLELLPDQQDHLPSGAAFFSEEDGRFEIELPVDSGVVGLLAVYAPGHPVTSLRLPITGELRVVLPPEGGRVEIAGPADPPDFLQNHMAYLYLQHAQGGIVPLADAYMVQEDVTLSEGVLTLGSLAPGSWRLLYLLPGQAASSALVAEGEAETVTLGWITSRPGRTSRLTLDLEPE